jgi:hypothetical protein
MSYAWRIASRPAAFGNSVALERQKDSSFAFRFKGRSITWYTMTGPDFGRAEVRIDGHSPRRVDLYAAHARARVPRRFDGLGSGRHTITITPQGHGRPRARDHLVAVDAFRTPGGIVRNPAGHMSWRSVKSGSASGGRYVESDIQGAAATLRFDGKSVDWVTVTGPDRGRARIEVDGHTVRTVDLYAPTKSFEVVESVGGLSDGPHTIRIVVIGSSRSASKGTLVAVDRFDVT